MSENSYAERLGNLVGALLSVNEDHLHDDWDKRSQERAALISRFDAPLAERIPALLAVERNVASLIDQACRTALRNGASFADVAKVLGISRQAASKRFGPDSRPVYGP